MNFVIISSENVTKHNSNIFGNHKSLSEEFLIKRLLRIAHQNNASKIVCIINENEQELEHFWIENNFGIKVEIIIQNVISHVNILTSLSSNLKGESFCIITNDLVFEESEFKEFLNYSSLQNEAEAIIAITRFTNNDKTLRVALDENDYIIKFSDSKEGYNWTLGGLFYFSDKLLNEFEHSMDYNILDLGDFLKLLIRRKHLLQGFTFSKIFSIRNVYSLHEMDGFLNEFAQ